MDDEKRQDERRRREAALGQTAEVRSGRAVPSRALNQMISLRLEPQLLRSLREIAEHQGVSVSDLLRQAAADFVARWRQTTFMFSTVAAGGAQQTSLTWSDRSETTAGVVVTSAERNVA